MELQKLSKKELQNLCEEHNSKVIDRKNCLYPNQMLSAHQILNNFVQGNDKRYVLLEALTQSGKTGVIQSLIFLMDRLSYNEEIKKLEHLYIMCGDNSVKLYEQNKSRIEETLATLTYLKITNKIQIHYLKNSDFQKELKNNITLTKNSLYVLDESHYGTDKEKNQVIQWLNRIGTNMKNEVNKMNENNCYFLSVSATPFIEKNSDINKSKEVIQLVPEWWEDDSQRGYVGFQTLFDNGNIISQENEFNDNTITEIFEYCNKTQKCAIIRISEEIKLKYKEKLEEYFKVYYYDSKNGKIDYPDLSEKIRNVNNIRKPCLFIIKGAFRMGITMTPDIKNKICVLYDVSSDIIPTLQGLLGRYTGYWTGEEWKNVKIYISRVCYIKFELYSQGKIKELDQNIKNIYIIDNNGDTVGCEWKYNEKNYPSVEQIFLTTQENEILKKELETTNQIRKKEIITKYLEKYIETYTIKNDYNWTTGRIEYNGKDIVIKDIHNKVFEEWSAKFNDWYGHKVYGYVYDYKRAEIRVTEGILKRAKKAETLLNGKKVSTKLTNN